MHEANITPLLEMHQLERASECLRTLSHPVRLRIVQLLIRNRFSVGELATECGIQNHMASEHLRLMQRSGLLVSRRSGRKIFYSLAKPDLIQLMDCIEKCMGDQQG